MHRYALLALVVAAVDFSGSDYLIHLGLVIGLHAVAALGLALLWGFTGQISLGQAAFYGLGAYGSAIIALRLGLSPWLSALVAVTATAAAAWCIGWLVFRLRGHYLAMATLGLGIITNIGFVEWRTLTGGPNGITSIPALKIGAFELSSALSVSPLIWLLCAAAMLLTEGLIRSPIGLAIRTVGENEAVAASLGIDSAFIKRRIFLISAGFAAASGAVYAHYMGYLSPGPFDIDFSVRLMLMVAIGGFTRPWGILSGVALVTVLGEILKPLGNIDTIVFGLLLVLTILFRPGSLQQRFSALRKTVPAIGPSP